MKFRLVWPAIVLMVGAGILMAFAGFVLGFFLIASFIVVGQWLSFSDVVPYLFIGLSGLGGSFLSIAHARRSASPALGITGPSP